MKKYILVTILKGKTEKTKIIPKNFAESKFKIMFLNLLYFYNNK